MKTLARFVGALASVLCLAAPSFAGFAGTEEFLAAVGNPEGAGGTQFFTTVWITDVSSSPVTFTFDFLRTGQANNVNPTSFEDTLQPGQTKMYEDVAGTKLGLTNANGAARITANGELFVSERIYNQPSGTELSATAGQFFSGIPKSFSIGLGESASLQGVYVGSGKDFRYNYVLLETSGANCSVHVRLLDDAGTQLGATDFPLLPYEHMLLSANSLAPSASSENARLVATVTSGAGTAIIAGSQVGNSSPQDQSGFEMSFPDEILAGGGAGVTSLNGLTGALTIAHGANTTVSVAGNTITIDAVSGSGTGLTAVAHDNSLAGSGTASLPLGIAPGGVGNAQLAPGAVTAAKIAAGQVVTSVNGVHDAVTLAAGSNVTITPSGNTFTIAATGGGGGGLTLPYSNSFSAGTGFGINNSGSSGVSIWGSATPGNADGVYGTSDGSGTGVKGISNGGIGVYGETTSHSSAGINGHNTSSGNDGYLGGPDYGVFGMSAGSSGVVGQTSASTGGVHGSNTKSGGGDGYLGGPDYGVFGTSAGSSGVVGQTSASTGGVHGSNTRSGGGDGYLGGPDYGVYGSSASNGVYGTSPAYGVYGISTDASYGVYGASPIGTGVYAEGFTGLVAHTLANGGDSAIFEGDISINGNLHTSGAGLIKFDDPADPAANTITHAFVGSSEMKNIYDGVTALGASGTATVTLPTWFETLNGDFRYQLTALGTPQAGLFVSKEVANNEFTIAGGVPGARVSWQLTGVRKDPWANAHPIQARAAKSETGRGFYIVPELYGQPKTKSADPVQRKEALKAAEKNSVER